MTNENGLPKRHKNKERNRIINVAVTDLDRIINDHDPEIHVPIKSGVWDRLDKMDCDLSDAKDARIAELEGGQILNRNAINRKQARIADLEAKLASWQAAQHYSYIGIDGKQVRAVDLENRAIEAEAKLATAMDGLRECEGEIDQYIRNEYPHDHPVQERYRKRDFAANPARTTIAEIQGNP